MNIYEESNGEYSLQIREDENPISPRQMNANMGKMICFHPRYILGDRHSYKNKDEFLLDLLTEHFNDEQRAKEYWDRIDSNTSFIPPFASEKLRDDVIIKELSSDHIIIPVFLYDHSGLSVSVNSFHDAWDSGQVGWIYADKQTVIKEYGAWTDENIEKTKQFMEGEVKEYDDYLCGENYIYDIIDEATGEVVDGGVWTGDLEDLKEDAREMMPEPMSEEEYKKLSDALYQKLGKEYDAFIDNVKKLSPQEIVDSAYQITNKYDLMCFVRESSMSREEYMALLNAPNTLETMYSEWIYMDTDRSDDLERCFHKTAREAQIAYPSKGGEAR